MHNRALEEKRWEIVAIDTYSSGDVSEEPATRDLCCTLRI